MLAFVVALSLTGRLAAQQDRGAVTGTVEDPTGAVIPNADITLTNTATNVVLHTTSTATGTYVFNAVLPGTYRVDATATGFQAFSEQGVVVQVQQVNTVNIKLATGDVKQTVTVTAAAPLLNAENAQLGQTVNSVAVNNLPLSTRDWGSLAQVSAGVTTAPANSGGGSVTPDAGSSSSAYFSVNGVNEWQNDFRLNGINDNIEIYGGNYTGTNAAIVPPPDAMQEFTLQSGDFSAQFGHSTGGIINAAIKSGTNGLHGDLWEYARNTILNSNYFFNRTCSGGICTPKAKPEYHQNLFGFTAGGPVVIPHLIHGKDRLFWFADYQGGRYVLPAPAGGETVPTLGMRNSGFKNLQDNITYLTGAQCGTTDTSKCATDALGRKFANGVILDPATTRQIPLSGIDPITGLTGTPGAYVRDPFYNCAAGGCPAANYLPGGPLTGRTDFTLDGTGVPVSSLNYIPASRLDPNAVNLLNVYPEPQTSGLTNNFGSYVPITRRNTNTYDVRVDASINPNNTIFGVYDRSLLDVQVPSNLPGLAVGETGGRTDSLPAYAWAVGYSRVFTPTLTNVMHVGMVHSDKIQTSVWGNIIGSSACSGTPTGACNIPLAFGIQGIPQVANNGGLPPTNIGGLTHIGVGNFTPTLQYVWSLEGVDDITKVFRSHTFHAGIQVDDLDGNISQPPQGRGDLSFNGMYTDIPNRISVTGNGQNGIGDLLVAPTAALVPGGVSNVGGQNQISGSNIAATDDQRWYYGLYFQDDWKVTPRFTANLGLRWDYFTPYAETNGRQANFVPTGGNSGPANYLIPNAGCKVQRSPNFDAAMAADNINVKCVSDTRLGNAQKTNFAPRVGFAWSLRPTLVVRGGFGIAYGALGNLGYGGTLGTNYPFVYTQTLPAPDSVTPLFGAGGPATLENAFAIVNFSDPNVVTGSTKTPLNVGINLYGREYNFTTPYVQTENITIQDQFSNHDSVTAGYVGTQGRNLDILGYTNGNSAILPNSASSQVQTSIPFPQFARNSTYETTNAKSNYNSLQVTYQHQMSAGLYLLANYTLSHCMTDQHTQASVYNGGYRAEWLPNFGIEGDYGLCDTDATHLVHVAGSWDLPFGHGRAVGATMNSAMNEVVGDWNINFFDTFQSGQPFTLNCYQQTSADFGCNENVVPNSDRYAGPHNYTQWLNPAAFALPPLASTIGQSDYSPLGGHPQQARGPSFANLDASLIKQFPIKDQFRFEFRAEAFNVTNTPPFAQPGQFNFTTSGFSQITATKNSNQNFGARTFQLALKLFY